MTADAPEAPLLPAALMRGIKDAALAISLANLCFIRPWFTILFDADFGYYNKHPVTDATLLALALNMLWVAVLFWLLATWMRRTCHTWLRRLAVLALLLLFLIPANFLRLTVFRISATTLTGFISNPLVLGAGVASAIAAWRWYRRVAHGVTMVLAVLLPLALLNFGKILLLLLHLVSLRQHSGEPVLASPLPQPKTSPRVVWVLFDEMDQRVVFHERPRGLQLPEFDRLRQQSLYATNAFPPASGTLLCVPALTTGRSVLSAKPAGPSDLSLTLADTQQTVRWSALPTLFSQARELGFNTAVVAWYHPFPRVLGASLIYGSFYAYPLYEQARGATFGEAMLNQLWANVAPLQQRRLEIKIRLESLADSLRLVTNSHYGVVFLHLPGPHTPCIYVPEKRRFTITDFSHVRGYFKNLALTDERLGVIRRAMEAAGTWEQTWLLVSSDHCWREAHRYDGRMDYRVPFILKPPGSRPPVTFTPTFNTVVSKDLILGILGGEITSLENATEWLHDRRLEAPPTYDGLQQE